MALVSPAALRKFIFDYFLANCRAPVLEEMMTEFKMTRDEGSALLGNLEDAHHIARVPGTDRILMANPLSALSTPFKVKIDQKSYFAACAWDAIAFYVMLGKATIIDSFCHHCADRIRIELSHQGNTSIPRNPLVFLSLPAARWWENIVVTCGSNMVFFSSQDHLDSWLKKRPSVGGESLTIDQTIKISAPIYTTKLSLDYKRPSKEELANHWASMGLKGEFWRL